MKKVDCDSVATLFAPLFLKVEKEIEFDCYCYLHSITIIKMECYMKWVTNNVDTFVPNEMNLVACVYCKEIYETNYFRVMHNCLVCKKCGIDALMVVKHSPLNDLTDEERKVQLEKWHVYGFTPLPPSENPPLRKVSAKQEPKA